MTSAELRPSANVVDMRPPDPGPFIFAPFVLVLLGAAFVRGHWRMRLAVALFASAAMLFIGQIMAF